MKPALTWTIAGTCLFLLTGAMAWATWSLVGMESTRHRMETEAVVQERLRLALWRMESVAASLVVEESARPPEQYAPIPEGQAATPPPAGSRVWLHFQMDSDGRVHSPEVPEGPDKPAVPDESAQRLQELRARLREKATPDQWAGLGLGGRNLDSTAGDNGAWMAEANSFRERLSEEQEKPPSEVEVEMETMATEDEPQLPEKSNRRTATAPPIPEPSQQQEYAPVQVASALKPSEAKREQEYYNKKDAGIRTKVFNELTRNGSQQQWSPSSPDSGANSQSRLAGNHRNREVEIADNAPIESPRPETIKAKPARESITGSPELALAKGTAAGAPGGFDSVDEVPASVPASRPIPEPPPAALAPPLTASAPPVADKSLRSLAPDTEAASPALKDGEKSLPDGLIAPPSEFFSDAKMQLGPEIAPAPQPAAAPSLPFPAVSLADSRTDSPAAVSPADSLTRDTDFSPGTPGVAAAEPQAPGGSSLHEPVAPGMIRTNEENKPETGLRFSTKENSEVNSDHPDPAKGPDRLTSSRGFAGGRALPDAKGLGESDAQGLGNGAPAQPAGLHLFGAVPVAGRTVSDFRALWIRDALFLTRRITVDGVSSIQGAWVDWPKLRSSLLETVSDLFPAASLEPAPAGVAGGTDLLASLPVRFLPGPLAFPAAPFWTPLKLSLATAWFCVLLATVAVLLVLRGMMLLSDRRASFVSAVTHELRTPLATFKLYSEMLADGMVKEETKRQQYLETLTTEADRLGHLVENVLSYSRLENGKVPGGRAPVAVRDLLRRLGRRLTQRVEQAGAEWQVNADSLPDDFSLTTDPAAVEQILFNLVDNACKYARRDGAAARVELDVRTVRGRVLFAVRDYWPGITRAESKRLFRPFHKSARAAAHSAPGVGLGLALCRRLASDLGGTLEPDHTWPHGACFVLRLPASGNRI